MCCLLEPIPVTGTVARHRDNPVCGGSHGDPPRRQSYFLSTMSFFIGPSTPNNSSFSVLPTLW